MTQLRATSSPPRQLVALTTFSDLVQEARERVKRDALAAGLPDDGKRLAAGGTGATAYADAVAVYLGVRCQSRLLTDNCIARAHGVPTRSKLRSTFRAAGNPDDLGLRGSQSLSDSIGRWHRERVEWMRKVARGIPEHRLAGHAHASTMLQHSVIS